MNNNELTASKETNFPAKRIGNYEIMLEDWKGKAPKGESWEVNGKWCYDYDAAMSIEFPDGFRLPTREEWVDICKLLDNKSERLQEDLGLKLNGFHTGTSVLLAGSLGYYWSSTYYSTSYAYILNFGSGSVNPQSNMSKYNGCTVMCLKNC